MFVCEHKKLNRRSTDFKVTIGRMEPILIALRPLALTIFPLGETAILFLFKESPLNKTLRSLE